MCEICIVKPFNQPDCCPCTALVSSKMFFHCLTSGRELHAVICTIYGWLSELHTLTIWPCTIAQLVNQLHVYGDCTLSTWNIVSCPYPHSTDTEPLTCSSSHTVVYGSSPLKATPTPFCPINFWTIKTTWQHIVTLCLLTTTILSPSSSPWWRDVPLLEGGEAEWQPLIHIHMYIRTYVHTYVYIYQSLCLLSVPLAVLTMNCSLLILMPWARYVCMHT